MADLTITTTSVTPGSNAVFEHGIAGEAIAAGKAVYKATAGTYMLADSNSATVAARTARGVALNGAAVGQTVAIQKSGDMIIGATLVNGATYFLSDTPGGICPDTDVGAGENVCQIGIAKSTTLLGVSIQTPGVTR